MIKTEEHYEGRGLLGMPDQSLQPTEPHVLADPINFPIEYKNWLVQYVQNELHIKQIPGYTAASSTLIPAITLPASPSDGLAALLTDSLATPTYAWEFRWSVAASKWIFTGGSPAYTKVDTAENISSATYVDAATVGPSFTFPRTGSYNIDFGFEVNNDASGGPDTWGAIKRGATATSDNDSVHINSHVASTSLSGSRSMLVTPTAADVYKMQYRVQTFTPNFGKRWMRITPVTVT